MYIKDKRILAIVFVLFCVLSQLPCGLAMHIGWEKVNISLGIEFQFIREIPWEYKHFFT